MNSVQIIALVYTGEKEKGGGGSTREVENSRTECRL